MNYHFFLFFMVEFEILPLILPQEDGSLIDKKKIQEIALTKLDECQPEDRAVAWIFLSHLIPDDPSEWITKREDLKKQYLDFVDMFKMNDYHTKSIPNTNEVTEFGTINDQLMELIHADMVRTSHHIPFFPFPVDVDKTSDDILLAFQPHMRRIERILFIFAQVNRTLSYAQGFNEIICPIFFVMLKALNYFNGNWDEVESTSFFIFQNMLQMTNLNELFTTQDKSSIIYRRMNIFMELLKKHLPVQHKIITGFDIHPLSFAFPWLNVLFAQFFMMPSLVKVWDHLMAHFDELVDYACYIGIGIIKMMGDNIDADDYIKTMTSLKKMTIDDVNGVLRCAKEFYTKDLKSHTSQSNSPTFKISSFIKNTFKL